MSSDHPLGTATVATLSAEVRVLQVGSRQVTLSVFRQLDFSPLIEPFGRVRPGYAQEQGRLWVVGRSLRAEDEGALVKSWVPLPEDIAKWKRDAAMSADPGWVVHEPAVRWRRASEAEREAMEAASTAWTRLPLIVLAGLR